MSTPEITIRIPKIHIPMPRGRTILAVALILSWYLIGLLTGRILMLSNGNAWPLSANAQVESRNQAIIEITRNGYSPESLIVKAGSKVSLTIKNTSGGGCIQTFTIPSLNIRKSVPVGSTEKIEFTAPSSATQIPFMCGMGMFRGVINVI